MTSLLLVHRTYVSFSVEGDALSYENVEQLLMQRRETLAELGFEILQLSQGMVRLIL